MASIGHIAVGMAAARIYPPERARSWNVVASMLAWSALSMLPDADVIGFSFGIRYRDAWGHRGATHSIAFALAVAVCIGLLAPAFRKPPLRTAVCAACVVGSHALLDTLTDGGLGCALLWPWSNHRYFAPWNPIRVAPIGRRFFSAVGISTALTELGMFAPLFLYALWPRERQPR